MGFRKKPRKKREKSRSSSSPSQSREREDVDETLSGQDASGETPESPPEPQAAPEPLSLASAAEQPTDFQSRLLEQLVLLRQQILSQQEEMRKQQQHQLEWEKEQEERLAGVWTAQTTRRPGRIEVEEASRDAETKDCKQPGEEAAQGEKEATGTTGDEVKQGEERSEQERNEQDRKEEEKRSEREENLVAKVKMLEDQLKAMQEKERDRREEETRKQSETGEKNDEAERREHEQEQLLTRLQFSIAYCSSFEPPYTPEMLIPDRARTVGKGWRSAPHCTYPQEVGLALEKPAQIKFLQLLSHESKIPRKVELWVSPTDIRSLPSSYASASTATVSSSSASSASSFSTSAALREAYQRASFTRLGYLRFSGNTVSRYRARELKSVNLPHFTECFFIKLVFVGPHCVPEVNPSFQVSLIAVNCLGRPLPPASAGLHVLPGNSQEANAVANAREIHSLSPRPASARASSGHCRNSSPHSSSHSRHSGVLPFPNERRGCRPSSTLVSSSGTPRQRLSVYLEEKQSLLSRAKKKFVEEENFAAAVLVRQALEKLAEAKPHIIALENAKQEAAAREAFEEARKAKAGLLAWQLCVKKTVAAALCCPSDPMTQAEEKEEKALLKDTSLIEHLAQKLPSASSPLRPSESLPEAATPLCPCDYARRLCEESRSHDSQARTGGRSESGGCRCASPPLSLDDIPIRPMREEQQRQLLLESPKQSDVSSREAAVPVLPSVGALRVEDEEDASPLLPFFPRDIVFALFAADIPTRVAAHEAVAQELEAHPEIVSEELFVALCPVIQRAFADKPLKMFLCGAHLLSLLLDAPGLPSRQFLSSPFWGVRQELLLRIGGVFSDRAKRLLLLLCRSHPEVARPLAAEIFDRLSTAHRVSAAVNKETPGFAATKGLGGTPSVDRKEEEKRRQSEGRGRGRRRGGLTRTETTLRTRGETGGVSVASSPQKSTTQLLQLFVALLSAFCLVEPWAPGGLPLSPLLALLEEFFQSASGDIRSAAVEITALLMLQLPHAPAQAKIHKFIETLRPKQQELIAEAVTRLKDPVSVPASSPSPTPLPASASSASSSSSSSASSPVEERLSTKARGRKSASPVARRGKAIKEGKKRENAEEVKQAQTPEAAAVHDTKEKEENVPLGLCEFCLDSSPDLASPASMDSHFLHSCPVLTSCPHCHSIVEVSHLPSHLLAECTDTDAYVRCEVCKVVVLKTQLRGHTQLGCKGNLNENPLFFSSTSSDVP
ncbi:UNVERIFIED_CONTAM: hypothetical protein HHA_289222 [Hammondia hammondi]|eukprot:XP_008889103.1 hypothetical protein HHA_289222 [Hammondia hammondi]